MRKSLYNWVFLLFLILSCAGKDKGENKLSVWVHSGQIPEKKAIERIIQDYNTQSDSVSVTLTIIPEGDYNAQIQSAALSGSLPDILEFDGPFMYNYIWQKKLRPIDSFMSDSLKKEIIPSILDQGTFRGRIYTIGMFDSGLALYVNRSILKKAGIEIPRGIEDSWTAERLTEILGILAGSDKDGQVIDLKMNYSGEWYTYAFSPVLHSAGAGLVSRPDYKKSSGVLNSNKAVEAMEVLQTWFKKGFVDRNIDDRAFVEKRVAFSWTGHWDFNRYQKALGKDLALIPLPDFGEGSRTGQGSWNWGITQNCSSPEKAADFLFYLLETDNILKMTRANGAIPSTENALRKSGDFGTQDIKSLFVRQLRKTAVPRPKTPAYPVITSVFQEAFVKIRDGMNVRKVLDRAASEIDEDITENEGYEFEG
ncbi:MAG: extracellular solute-binding protein [Fibrobacterota bacterium]